MRAVAVLLCLLTAGARAEQRPLVRVGSKKFTESVILGELACHLVREAGGRAEHRRELGGSRILWEALLAGEIDLYPEYTGTLREELLAGVVDLEKALAGKGLRLSRSLGFNNTYALGMKADRARALGIRTISDLVRHPDLRLGFSEEFKGRQKDGWPGLRERYALPHRNVRGLDHDLAYRGLDSGDIDVIDLYSTDGKIRQYAIVVLEDDRRFFPDYQAVWLYRADLQQRLPPAILGSFLRLEGRISEADMIEMNARSEVGKERETVVAADFLNARFRLSIAVEKYSWLHEVGKRTLEHLALVSVSLLSALVVAVPLGILAAKLPALGQVVLTAAGIVQTIPSLALLVFLIPLLGIGAVPAVAALFLYSLLPIVRNTHAGLTQVPGSLRESAAALGLPPAAILRLVELPLASRTILAGIKTAAVINVGTATLGALIGAGGYGQPILAGIRLGDLSLILQGAIPAAALALLVQGLFELAERTLTPRGLRL